MIYSKREWQEQKYRERLSQLAGQRGRRNSLLLGLCNHGVMAGVTDEQMLSEIRNASGTPPLDSDEIRHALQTARRDVRPEFNNRKWTRRKTPSLKKTMPSLGTKALFFVPRMIAEGQGATFESLMECSPIPIPSDTREQARIFLQNLYNAGEWLFIAPQYAAGRIGQDIRTADEWQRVIGTAPLPPLLMANPLTGREGMTKDNKPSFRCGKCVAAFRFSLVEFDGMPLPKQYAFWAGVIESDLLPLRSLVYSGGKSIHGLIEINAKDREDWARKIQTIQTTVCNPAAQKEHQADCACKDVGRLTRLAGAYRIDKGKVQSLLWLSSKNTKRIQFTTVPPPPSPVPHGGIADGFMRCPIPPPMHQKTYLPCPPSSKLF